jgi:hypothetical protein
MLPPKLGRATPAAPRVPQGVIPMPFPQHQHRDRRQDAQSEESDLRQRKRCAPTDPSRGDAPGIRSTPHLCRGRRVRRWGVGTARTGLRVCVNL